MNYIWTSNDNEIVITNIVDGDTIDVYLKLPFDISTKKRLRLARIDAPEIRSKNKEEKEKGLKCKEYVRQRIEQAKELKVVTYKAGKYGRYLADLFIDGANLNKELVEKGYAKSYGR